MILQIALSILKGTFTMAWWRKDTKEDDEVFYEAADVVGNALGDADAVRKKELETGKNLRDQLTVGEVEEITEEVKMRKFGWLRN